MNNIYNALMKAADRVSEEPHLYKFFGGRAPESLCGSPACMLGWTGYFLGMSGAINWDVAVDGLGLQSSNQFYHAVSSLLGDHSYVRSPESAARGLRLYAEKYHGHEKPNAVAPPDWKTIAASPLIPDHVRSEEAVS